MRKSLPSFGLSVGDVILPMDNWYISDCLKIPGQKKVCLYDRMMDPQKYLFQAENSIELVFTDPFLDGTGSSGTGGNGTTSSTDTGSGTSSGNNSTGTTIVTSPSTTQSS